MLRSEKRYFWGILFLWHRQLMELADDERESADAHYWRVMASVGLLGYVAMFETPLVFAASFTLHFSPWWTLVPLTVWLAPGVSLLAFIAIMAWVMRIYAY